MKKIIYLLVVFALLVSFTSCEEKVITTPGNYSMNIVNKAEIPLTIKSVKSAVFYEGDINDVNFSEMIINTELLPGENKTIDFTEEYDINYRDCPYCYVKLDCSYNDNEIPVVGYVNGAGLFFTRDLLQKFYFIMPPETVLEVDFGFYTDYKSKEQVYALTEGRWK